MCSKYVNMNNNKVYISDNLLIIMLELRTDFTEKECKLLYNLYCIKTNERNLTASKMASEIEISVTNPYFYRLLNYLIESKIVSFELIGKTRIFKIDRNKLEDLIDIQEIVKYWHDVIYDIYVKLG